MQACDLFRFFIDIWHFIYIECSYIVSSRADKSQLTGLLRVRVNYLASDLNKGKEAVEVQLLSELVLQDFS